MLKHYALYYFVDGTCLSETVSEWPFLGEIDFPEGCNFVRFETCNTTTCITCSGRIFNGKRYSTAEFKEIYPGPKHQKFISACNELSADIVVTKYHKVFMLNDYDYVLPEDNHNHFITGV